MKTEQENLNQLPYACYGVLKSENRVILIHKGEMGYRNVPQFTEASLNDVPGIDSMDKIADELNAIKKTTKSQRKAMEWGSQFGWGHGLADASRYDANGNIVSTEKV